MMQSAIQIDTHRSVKELIGSGMPEAQAEALVAVLTSTVGNPNLVTKDDAANFATKEDTVAVKEDIEKALTNFATKKDLELAVVKLEAMIEAQDAKFVTKEEFEAFKTEVFRRFAKLEERQSRLEEKVDNLATQVKNNTEQIKKNTETLEQIRIEMRERDMRQLRWLIGFGIALIGVSLAT